MSEQESDPRDAYIQMLERERDNQRIKVTQYENQSMQESINSGMQPNNLFQYQLDLSPILEELYNLLSGKTITFDPITKTIGWTDSRDKNDKILTAYGVKQIMNIVKFHVNPNTLLSFYTQDQINAIMLDFSYALNSLLFNQQELFYNYEKPEEIYENVLKEAKFKGKTYTELELKELFEYCKEWSQEDLDNKFSNHRMICENVIAVVRNAYQRSIEGKERKSLREQTHISQSYSTAMSQQGGIKR